VSTGDLLKAVEYFGSFYNLTKARLWQNDEGENLHSMSCENLRRVHTAIADGVNISDLPFTLENTTCSKINNVFIMQLKEEDMMESINYLLKAYEMAKESEYRYKKGLHWLKLL